ncbi:hypothetical protein BaRGS_00019349 [Batillaria attramentaria]|uniref:Tudor domain-containing protein 7 n=1 Tax=Batillaria attramentaria TaxID=370345 RepID=A0ABD0KQ75_9CAEN
MAGEDEKQLKSTKAMIRSVLISEKDGVPASRFMGDYRGITGENIPYKNFGYKSLEDFIRSIPDVVYARTGRGGELTYFAVADEATAHIQKLVSKQKSKKTKPVRRGPARYPKAHSQFRKGGHSSAPYRPSSGFSTPFAKPKMRSPPYGGAFSSADVSPLMVTVRSTSGNGLDQRLIERRAVPGINGGRKMATRALRAAFGEKGPERKCGLLPNPEPFYGTSPFPVLYGMIPYPEPQCGGFEPQNFRSVEPPVWNGPLQKGYMMYSEGRGGLLPLPHPSGARQYELPPRFQRLNHGGAAPSSAGDRPVAGEGPALREDELPSGIKTWVSTLLKGYPNGLWSTRFLVLYKEKFKQEAPSTLIDIISQWSDVAMVEMNTVANRQVLYPTPDKPPTKALTPDKPQQPVQHRQPASLKETRPVWQDFIVPDAELLSTEASTYVYTSYLVSLGHFYVQDEQSCVEDITTKLGAACKDQAVPKMSDLHTGVYCAALYHEDNSWYRARILYTASENEIEVYFIDYGNVEKVPLANIRCLTKETAEIPAQAINCTLFGLKPLTVEIMNEGQCVVELFTEEAGDESLNQRLFEAGLVATYLKSEEVDGEPPDLELPESEYIEVVVAYMDLHICIIRLVGPNFSEKLEEFEDSLQTLYAAAESSGKPKNLSLDSVCIASVDHLYHRVRIVKLEENEAQCLFVDHGYTEKVPLSQLQPLDPEVNKTVSYQAIPCLLAGLENFMKLPTTMQDLITMSQNKICMAEIDCRDPLTVMLYDTNGEEDININKEIAKKLVAEGAKIDMDVFASTESAPSEGSGTSSPRSHASASGVGDVERLQSAAQCLSLGGGALSPAEVGASQSRIGPTGKSDDSLSVAYHTWPIPGYVPLPSVGEFIDVYVIWISDPFNFVMSSSGDVSQTPTAVPEPQMNHLYMTVVDDQYYRAIYKGPVEDGLHVFCPDYCTHHLVSRDQLYFLPKQFWSLPFAAYKARLHGVQPTAKHWLESSKYKFVELALNKILVALIKAVEGDTDLADDDDNEEDVIRVPQQQLSLHLVDTSDSRCDVIIADALVDYGLAESAME